MGEWTERQCWGIAARQQGAITRCQAKAAGMTVDQIKHRVATGTWRRMYPSVYGVAAAPATWRQRLRAASLWAGFGHAFSHRTAAALWRFARFREGPLEVSTSRHLRPFGSTVVHVVEPLLASELRLVDGLRVTSPARTLLDLCAIEDKTMMRATLDEALRRKLTTLEVLVTTLERAARRPGVQLLRTLVGDAQGSEGPTESELEQVVLEFLEAEGFPKPRVQAHVTPDGKRRRLDVLFPGVPLVIEADGYAYHSSVTNFEGDRDRNNELIARGYRVLHWTWAGLHERPEELAEQLRHVLGGLGVELRPRTDAR